MSWHRVSHTSTRVLGHDLGRPVQIYGVNARCGEWLLTWGRLVGSEDFDRTVYKCRLVWVFTVCCGSGWVGEVVPFAHLRIDIDTVAFILILIRLQQS